ncbi:unnamed protein product [Arabidopsis lyrata]|uniref:uncharacterized protein LOC110226394 n=1 Tax=Arabidopsis lyrata subsp. lyrata TaxID=81972 RepID=UPI000A29E174|nr:uncharacterized protein LOC110226394 [Arabidopsis lyrata subsp. lyrata]CAH8275788.1 unnamed protein product [Arabidopsis lyrata]|eukprot:XP_020873716.1 uncharacterized protein LOC110226394 [Arabidopsis lyrata subsp. lyrata]
MGSPEKATYAQILSRPRPNIPPIQPPEKKKDLQSEAEVDPRFEVPFLWDFENSPIRSDQVAQLEANINSSLKTLHPKLHLAKRKYGAGNTNLDFVYDHEDELDDMGFHMEDSVITGRYCSVCNGDREVGDFGDYYMRLREVADRMILQQLQRHVLNGSPSNFVLLVSRDADFKLSMEFLKAKNYIVFLAILGKTNEAFTRTGNYVWDWGKMPDGNARPIWPPVNKKK